MPKLPEENWIRVEFSAACVLIPIGVQRKIALCVMFAVLFSEIQRQKGFRGSQCPDLEKF